MKSLGVWPENVRFESPSSSTMTSSGIPWFSASNWISSKLTDDWPTASKMTRSSKAPGLRRLLTCAVDEAETSTSSSENTCLNLKALSSELATNAICLRIPITPALLHRIALAEKIPLCEARKTRRTRRGTNRQSRYAARGLHPRGGARASERARSNRRTARPLRS